jgi:hypothetical protein
VIPLGSDQILQFNKEKKDGIYGIDVKVFLNLRFKLGSIKKKAEPKVHCDLKVPLKSLNGTLLGNAFISIDCVWICKRRLFC